MGSFFSSAENAEALKLKVYDLSRGGAGVAEAPNGKKVFLPFTLPGDVVRGRILKESKKYAQGEVVEILTPSPQRQKPKCEFFRKCGGCEWQHVPYSLQFSTKKKGVLSALSRVGIVDVPKIEEYPARKIWNYRNRIQLRGDEDHLGFYASGTHRIVDVSECQVARVELNRALASLWEKKRILVERSKPFKVEISLGADGRVRNTWNRRHGAAGFTQIHEEQNQKLKDWVSEVFVEVPFVLDLFGGVGNLSERLIGGAQEIHCVDYGANEQVRREKTRFYRSSVLKWLTAQSKKKGWREKRGKTVAILDPPREGLGRFRLQIIEGLLDLGVQEIVAVGCDADAWAKDLLAYQRAGWALGRHAVFDFFPQTHHVESAAWLTWRPS